MSRRAKQAEAKMREQLAFMLMPLAERHGLVKALQPTVDFREQEAALDALRSKVTFKELMAKPLMDGSPPGSPAHWAVWSVVAAAVSLVQREGFTLTEAVRSIAEASFETSGQREVCVATVGPVAYWFEHAPDAAWAWERLSSMVSAA